MFEHPVLFEKIKAKAFLESILLGYKRIMGKKALIDSNGKLSLLMVVEEFISGMIIARPGPTRK